MLASTFFDMVLGVDIHFEMVPMPAPTPTPIPNPFVGMVFDPAGLLIGQAMTLAVALATGTPPAGPVLINSLPATTVGTNAINALGLPHIMMPPGTAWAPMPKLPKPAFKGKPPMPGPPVAPEGDALSIFGSRTVSLMGFSAVRMGDLSMSCAEPVRLPSSVMLAIPKGRPVMIGGPPAISLMDAAGVLLRTKWGAGLLHDLLSRMKPGRLRNFFSKAVCFLTGHPVDVATGRVLTDHVDWELPGALPLKFERSYSSAWANRAGPLGHGWSHTLDQAVWGDRGKIVYLDGEGRELELDTFDRPDHVLGAGQSLFDPVTRLTLRALGARRYAIDTPEGTTLDFAPVEGATGGRRWWSRLVRMTARNGGAVHLDYDGSANLAWVRDSGGRSIGFEHDAGGRLTAVKLPHPTQPGWRVHTRYAYDAQGDLCAVTDPLGGCWRFAYKQHLLVQETNRNGLSFYFAYDGHGEDASCVRTWGDGGIYDHIIDYDKAGKVTCVTNSLGHTTMYKMNAVGCVVKITDALGGATAYEYDERTLRKLKETSTTGGETKWEYDERGNTTKVTGPDGSETLFEYDEHDRPVRAVDAMKGVWQWGHDDRGLVVGRVDPMDRRTQLRWRQEGGPRSVAGARRLAAVIDPAGQETSVRYDAQGNPVSMTTPDGAEHGWEYDNLGRCVTVIDAKGNAQRRDHDDLGRVVRFWEPDGNLRELDYDPEGNIVAARDKHHDVRLTYRGMGRLASRTEAGTTVALSYDTEERLIGIANEHGHVYRFQRGPTGNIDVENGFDGVRRRYTRDKAGRVVKIHRPARAETAYTYDQAGRIVGVKHSTGETEAFAYRADGELIEATNGAATVKLERDPLGRVVREVVGDDWVASERDALGMRVRVRSSRGLDQRILRNAAGHAVRVRAAVGGPARAGDRDEGDRDEATAARREPWEARIARDAMGLEIERALPGGVHSRWQRDAIGRPVQREVTAAGGRRRAVEYTWDAGDRLRAMVDAARGPTRYEHDALGSLLAAIHQDGRVDLRMPDAVGNLFRAPDRGDRTYGPGGQLLEAREPDGRTVTHSYDSESNLTKKIERAADGERIWTYHWNGAGLLAKVVRPDGETVELSYDAFARRLAKTFRGRTTRWLWDEDVPLHEWPLAPSTAKPGGDAAPPDAPAVTWLFDPGTFTPIGKLAGESRYAIVTDHLGAPTSMYDERGAEVWSATIDVYGDLRDVEGGRADCPFRWPGQYEDVETGLYYNRFRYYDPSSGHFMSPDPIGLNGGLVLRGYVSDPLTQTDPLGLDPIGDLIRGQAPVQIPPSATMHNPTVKTGGGWPFHHTEWRWTDGNNVKWSARFHGVTQVAHNNGDIRAVWVITRRTPGTPGSVGIPGTPAVEEVLKDDGTWVPKHLHASGSTGPTTHLDSCRG